MYSAISPQMTFAEAFDLWLGGRVISHAGIFASARYITARTVRDLKQYKRAAAKFFTMPLADIHAGHLHAYQKARAFNVLSGVAGEQHPWEQPAGANLIRKEVGLVLRILKAAGAWSQHLEECYEPLQPEQNDVPRAMSPEEQHRWLHTASTRGEWQIVYQWSMVALQTTMATNEIRALRLGDISLKSGYVQVRSEGAKNKFRIRTIPLQTPEVVWALNGLIDRAIARGSSAPHMYLFPFHVTQDRYDPLRPMSAWGLRGPWDEVRAASKIEWLRPYDLRHTGITRMAEAGVPIQVIMSFAGHMSPRMQQHYTAISMEAKRRWAAAAWATANMPHAPGLPQAQAPATGKGRWIWQPEELEAVS